MIDIILDKYFKYDITTEYKDAFPLLDDDRLTLLNRKTPRSKKVEILEFILTFMKVKFKMKYMFQTENVMFKRFKSKKQHIVIFQHTYHDGRIYVIHGIIDDENKKFLFIGEDEQHPFYIYNDTSYGNSTVTGPGIHVLDFPNLTANEITDVLLEYYMMFANNAY